MLTGARGRRTATSRLLPVLFLTITALATALSGATGGTAGPAAAQAADAPARVPAARVQAMSASFEQAVVDRINLARSKRGLVKLTHGEGGCLDRYADAYARRMANDNKLAHHLNGQAIFADCGGRRVGEVIAVGFDSPATVVRMWMNSTGHRTVIMKPAYRVASVGAVRSAQGNAFVSVLVWHR